MLKIYKNKTPNQPNGLHYVFSNFSNYLAELGTPFLQFTLDNYRINGGTIEVATNAPYSDVDAITYVIDNRDNYNRCYFVDYAEIQSGYLVLRVHVDWWASYLYKATVSNLRVTRCNRNVGIGVYDKIQATTGVEFGSLSNRTTVDEDELSIVFVAIFATGTSSILVNNSATALEIYRLDLSDLTIPSGSGYGTKLKYAIDLVGGIYSVDATIGTLDAAVLKAYVVMKNTVPSYSGGATPIFKTRPAYASGTIELSDVTPLGTFYHKQAFNLTIDPDKEYYVGTRYNGLKLVRTTESTIEVDIETIVKQDGLQVLVRQGAQMLDITDAFSVGLTSNDGNLSATQQIAKGIQAIGGVASGAFQIMKGGAGYVTGALQITSAIAGMFDTGNAKYQAAGDGLSTFLFGYNVMRYPYCYAAYTSTDNEKKQARLFGATYNQQIASIDSVFTFPYLGSGTAETYLAATCEIDGICMNARDDIIAQLKEGVYIKKL